MVPAGSYLVCRWIRLKPQCLPRRLNAHPTRLKNAVTSKFTCNPMSIAQASAPRDSEIRSRCFLSLTNDCATYSTIAVWVRMQIVALTLDRQHIAMSVLHILSKVPHILQFYQRSHQLKLFFILYPKS